MGYQHWNTPNEVLEPLREFLPITLDPCSNSGSIVNADVNSALPTDGLKLPWYLYTHTFVNPPYDNQPAWLAKAVAEFVIYDAFAVTMLIPASPETNAFVDYVWGYASAVAFWQRRIKFDRHDRSNGQSNKHPSALCYWGREPDRFAEHFRAHATVCTDWTRQAGAPSRPRLAKTNFP